MTRRWKSVIALALLALACARPARADDVDRSGWKALLQKYVVTVSHRGEPLDTRFDYAQLYVDEDIWHRHASDRLAAIRSQLLAVRPSRLAPKERVAWAIDAYNFLVVEHVTLNLLVPGRKFMRYDSPRQINTAEGTFFEASLVTIDGVAYSLTGFERRFVYGDTTANPMATSYEPRTAAGDPRLAFALCRGSLGSGLILPWTYSADSLDRQLDRAARLALALPRFVTVNVPTGELVASNEFFDQRADFGGPEMPDLMPFLEKYGPRDVKAFVHRYRVTRPTRFTEVDWKLNVIDHLPERPPAPADSSAKP